MMAEHGVEPTEVTEIPVVVGTDADRWAAAGMGDEPSGAWWDGVGRVAEPDVGDEARDGPVELPSALPEGSGEAREGEQGVPDMAVSGDDKPSGEESRGVERNGSGRMGPQIFQNVKAELGQLEARLLDRFGDLGSELKAMRSAVERDGGSDGEALKPLITRLEEMAGGIEEARHDLTKKMKKVVDGQEGMPELLGRFQGAVETLDGTVTNVGDQLRQYRKDVDQWRRPKSKAGGWQVSVAVVVVLTCLGIYGGMSVQQQFSLLEIPDESGGWKGYIWDSYGRAIVECATEARRQGQEIECKLAVTAP